MQQRLRFFPQIESLRFFAVLLVIISHWVPGNVVNVIPNGFIGVTFFFVLSGYLISGNLLYLKASVLNKELTIFTALKIFFYKRTLRIFPLYFFVILFIYLLNKTIFANNIGWYLTYSSNFLIFFQQEWQGMISHFWSLAVEEQFYLVWPFLIFLINNKYLKYFFLGIVLVSIAFKYFAYSSLNKGYIELLPISCFDAFGFGALLAYIYFEKSSMPSVLQNINQRGVLILLCAFSILVYNSELNFMFGFFVSALSFVIINQAIKGIRGVIGVVLSNSFIRYLGRISYGLYIFHNLVPWLWRCITSTETKYPINIGLLTNKFFTIPAVALTAQFLLLLVICTISWYAMEKPIINLKNIFSSNK